VGVAIFFWWAWQAFFGSGRSKLFFGSWQTFFFGQLIGIDETNTGKLFLGPSGIDESNTFLDARIKVLFEIIVLINTNRLTQKKKDCHAHVKPTNFKKW